MSRITIIQCNGCGKRLRGHRHWPRRRDLYRLRGQCLAMTRTTAPNVPPLLPSMSGRRRNPEGIAHAPLFAKERLWLIRTLSW